MIGRRQISPGWVTRQVSYTARTESMATSSIGMDSIVPLRPPAASWKPVAASSTTQVVVWIAQP